MWKIIKINHHRASKQRTQSNPRYQDARNAREWETSSCMYIFMLDRDKVGLKDPQQEFRKNAKEEV